MNALTRTFAIGLTVLAILLPVSHAQTPLDDAARRSVVEKAADALRNRYIFPEVGETAAAKIQAQLAAGAYKDLQLRDFAEKLTADLYAIAKDKHLRVTAPGVPLAPVGSAPPSPPPRSQGGVVRADRLAGDVGYIEVVGFPPREVFSLGVDPAMAALRDTKALIVDVRRNGGGSPDAVAYLVSHFLDGTKPPVLINDFVNRKSGTKEFTTQQSFSVKTPVSYLGKHVYVLTSPRTFSGGEEFAYDMQAFKLGTLVGATTGGGANPGGVMPIGSQLAIFMPNGRPINPVTKTNWEGIGVIPDIATPVEDALKVALERLGQKPAEKDIDVLSQAKLVQPRTTPYPEGEAAIRRMVGELARGEPNYDLLTPGMADATRRQLSNLKETVSSLGELKTVRFMEIGPQGADVYDLTFANGSITWRIALNDAGKVAFSGFSRNAFPTPTGEARMAAFKAADKDGDGKLDKAGYLEFLKMLGFADQLDSLFGQRDVNRDGFVSADEYKNPIPQ
jgi:hypothetical protein